MLIDNIIKTSTVLLISEYYLESTVYCAKFKSAYRRVLLQLTTFKT